MKKKICCDCGKSLARNEIALSRKLLDLAPDSEELYCLPCLARYFDCSENYLKNKIQEFKEQGCTMFL